jgi:hypothetical protein
MKKDWSHLEKWRVTKGVMASEKGMKAGAFVIPQGPVTRKVLVVASNGPEYAEGDEWEHVSVSRPHPHRGVVPTWDAMCAVKDLFWDPEEEVVQFHPKASEYVNVHEACLHLWRHKDGHVTPPTVLVGPHESNKPETLMEIFCGKGSARVAPPANEEPGEGPVVVESDYKEAVERAEAFAPPDKFVMPEPGTNPDGLAIVSWGDKRFGGTARVRIPAEVWREQREGIETGVLRRYIEQTLIREHPGLATVFLATWRFDGMRPWVDEPAQEAPAAVVPDLGGIEGDKQPDGVASISWLDVKDPGGERLKGTIKIPGDMWAAHKASGDGNFLREYIHGRLKLYCDPAYGHPCNEVRDKSNDALMLETWHLDDIKAVAGDDDGDDKMPEETPFTHVDEWVDSPRFPAPADEPHENYARWMFLFFRLPAMLNAAFRPYIKDRKLFCTYGGKRWRVTGASRMGDIWLAGDFNRDHGYDERVDLSACSQWGPEQ